MKNWCRSIKSNALLVLVAKDISPLPNIYDLNSILIPIYVADNGHYHLDLNIEMDFIYNFRIHVDETANDTVHAYTNTNLVIEKQNKYNYIINYNGDMCAHIHFAPFNEGEKVIDIDIEYNKDIITRLAIVLADNPRSIADYTKELSPIIFGTNKQLEASHVLFDNHYIQFNETVKDKK